MDPGNCPGLGGRPEEAADSEVTADSVPEDGQEVSASGSAEGRGNSSSGTVGFDGHGAVAVDGWVVVRRKFSEPYFLKRRCMQLMLESGFVAVDPATGMPGDRFHLSDQCRSTSLLYSLPELLVARNQSLNVPGSLLVKFQSLGQFIVVYGCLPRAKLGLRRLCLDRRSFAPSIRSMWAKGEGDDVEEDGGFSSSYPIKAVSEAGLPLPSCFPGLLTELKLKIFESLSGIDLAMVGCVCSELRSLTSNNDLWKQKCQRFARLWEAKKKGRGRVVGRRCLRDWTGFALLGSDWEPCGFRKYNRMQL
ncbi:hypothetical protein ACJRO7_035988 [Eucalyptus globulus]|uniref:F-box domain-containing protein n=1 Tax=Eucalyptus globulus TaxID=34317 RepID=A0ABD3JDJ7_EUCGL